MSLDVSDTPALEVAVAAADVVVSLIPYTLHVAVIEAAIKGKTHVVTTSYVSPAIRALEERVKAAGIVVMNEIGLDPGIDHLYAVKTIDEVHTQGGKVISLLARRAWLNVLTLDQTVLLLLRRPSCPRGCRQPTGL
jgi:spermidine synthase / saccharopine dehydrogenase (NADP+, L-glutamate-forming)